MYFEDLDHRRRWQLDRAAFFTFKSTHSLKHLNSQQLHFIVYTGLNCFLGAERKNYFNNIFINVLILNESELIDQRLSAEPKGNSAKHAKQVPREFVPFKYSEVALENTKHACKVYYRKYLTTCYIVASKQGPSCFGQIKFQAFRSFMLPLLCKSLERVSFQKCQDQIHSKSVTTHKNTGELYLCSAQ